MTKRDFELLSNEELKSLLNDLGSYSEEEVRCARRILLERLNGQCERQKTEGVLGDDEIPGYSERETRTSCSYTDICEIKKNIRTIKACAVFFVVLTTVSVVAGFIIAIAALV